MSKPMTMVERVARALCAHDGYGPDEPGIMGGTAEFMWQHYRGDARAAIEAMREPNEAMIAAMWDTKFPEGGSMGSTLEYDNKGEVNLELAWSAGIAAALSEEGE